MSEQETADRVTGATRVEPPRIVISARSKLSSQDSPLSL